jgi:KipI family sensor histidine kinase inhibitor
VSPYPHVVPLGDSALLAVLGDGVSLELSARVARLSAELHTLRTPGLQGIVPAYAAVALHFDAGLTDADALAEQLAALARAELEQAAPDPSRAGRLHVIPVRYDGPDLPAVAEQARLSIAEVVRRHAERTYQVLFLGFVPGFGYLGPLDPGLALPRRAEPRRRVPSGSVAIAGEQTGIYPAETPGGWHLIGRTDRVMFDPNRDPPNLLAAGDRVRFEPIA